MLNTDLHNVAIEPKISLPQYVASCHRCVPLQHVPDTYLRTIYLSVRSSPLRISPCLPRLRARWCLTALRGSVGGSLLPRRPRVALCNTALLLVTAAGRDAEEERTEEEE